MIQLGCRPWNLSLVFVIILAVSNVLLTFLLMQSETCAPNSNARRNLESKLDLVTEGPLERPKEEPCTQSVPKSHESVVIDDPIVFDLDIKLGKWDSRRLYRTFDAVLTGSAFYGVSQTSKVCLATQTSVEKLYSIVEVVHQWSGPISVAVFAAGDEEFEVLQKYITYLVKCFDPVKERVLFSLAIPKNKPPKKQPQVFDIPDFFDCDKPEDTLKELSTIIPSSQTTWRIRNVYPQNHMRNLARKNCQTDYVFLTDVDIVPSSRMSEVLDEFLDDDTCEKCAFVIPTYELDARVKFPPNKSDLVRLANKGLARPFHQKVFINNQFATNFTRWMLDAVPSHTHYENVKTGKVYISHDVTNFEFLYEPFYVAKDIVPPHDERFMGYGFTRNTQVYEMYLAGYKFKVLSPVFTVHWGLQTRKGRPAWRERQNDANRKNFEVFQKEVIARYVRDPHKVAKKHSN